MSRRRKRATDDGVEVCIKIIVWSIALPILATIVLSRKPTTTNKIAIALIWLMVFVVVLAIITSA